MQNVVIATCIWGLLLLVSLPLSARTHQFTYAWPYAGVDDMRPRGGTTSGPAVTLDPGPGAAWAALQAPGLTPLERDRRAILAMAGPYRTSFDFIETVGFTSAFTPARPYQSWGTEYVYVVEDRETFISLQHIIVMFFDQDGEVVGPMVVKHWRQDWRYQDRDLHEYAGHNSWRHRRLPARAVKGAWSQAVYQVDDSPRYESVGVWRHQANHSSWQSGETWRPLPRREFSVRDDYHVLVGTNRHTLTPSGWVQEEDNLKVVLDADGTWSTESPVLAREAGLNRYERIRGHDFSAGDAYWARTGAFWADVRTAWADLYRTRDAFRLRDQVAGKALYQFMFDYAGQIDAASDYDRESGRAFIEQTLDAFVE